MFHGFLDLSIGGYIIAALVLTHITIAGVTIFLHRHQAHRALDLHPIISHFFRFWLWLSTGIVTKEWAAVHRKHHAKCETPDDPHSPVQKGINKVFWQGALLYRQEAVKPETRERYGHGTPDDWLETHLYTPHNALGIGIMLVIDVLLFGVVAGPIIWAVQMIWIPLWAAGVINGIGHYWGYRNYECPDASKNIVPWGILIGGEELHNNHHAFASSAKLSSKWWEFDIGWMYIRIMEGLGLAHVKKIAPKPVIEPSKASIDLDTLRAVVLNRLQVFTRYGKDVILPVLRDEIGRADGATHSLLKRVRGWAIRDAILVDESERRELESAIDLSEHLKTVYQFREQLQTIWARSTETQENLLHNLQEWCNQAEATGIRALQDFAHSLRGYTLAHQA